MTDLAVSRAQAAERIKGQLAKGDELLNAPMDIPPDLKNVRDRYYTWDEYNTALLGKLFTTDEEAESYSGGRFAGFGAPDDHALKVEYYRDDIQRGMRHLTSVLERLELFDEPATTVPASGSQAEVEQKPASRRVFIVHGHDPGLKEAVARLIQSLGYEPVILHEQPDGGRTTIEKFERESREAAFAVILLTPDDEGRARDFRDRDPPDLVPRARQNVVWEFGYFMARLGREHVAALSSDGKLERPSDLGGLLYTPVAESDDRGWRVKLAREMKTAGLDINLNDVK